MTGGHSPPATTSGVARWKWLLGAAGVAGLIMTIRYVPVQDLVQQALREIAKLGPWGPVLFVVVYIAATVLFIPGSLLTLGAGAVFGVGWGSVYVSLASTLGATAAFYVGRYFARDLVVRKIEGNPKFDAIDRAVAEEGWKIVGLTRLSPVFPFTLLNYAFGLTRVKAGHYIVASWIGMMPATVMYVYLGSLAKAAAYGQTRTPGERVLYAVGLLATVAVTITIARAAKKALADRIQP